MKKVKVPPVRVRPALTRDFLGSLRGQVNTMIDRVQAQVKPIRVRVIVDAPSRRALTELTRQAPITVGAVAGHIAPRAGLAAGGVEAGTQARINALLSRGAAELGGVAVAEEKVAKVRERGVAVGKQSLSQTERTARANKAAAQIEKELGEIEFRTATVTGQLAQEKRGLALADKLVERATANRAFQLTAESKAAQDAAIAERTLRLERVRGLEEAAAAAGTAGVAGRTGTVRRAQQAGFGNLTAAVTSLREADVAFTKTGKSAKDLAAQEAILAKRSEALKASKLAVSQALKGESAALRLATQATLQKAEADKAASQAAVQNIQHLVSLQDKQAKATAAAARQQAQLAARQASSERRRSEQLSRGGQASLLSLAGIRGATLAASRSFLVGAAAITVFARAVKQFADLERNLDVFRATTSATANQMEAVRKEATALGADLTLPAVSAGDAAGAMVELAKAGLSVQDSIAGARGVLELSTAAAIDNADAVRLVANVLNAFSLSGREAITVADTLANAANAAQGSIADIGTAFQQAASAGHQVGLSFQDTATFLTILAKNGLRGSDAGTSLRTALIRLVNPSKAAAEQFQKLGIVLRDAAGNLRPDVFIQIANATKELTPAQRDATIALIGGQDAFRAVTILGRQSVGSFLAMRAALRQTGTAAELAKARTEGLHGAMDGLQSVLETVGTTAAGHVGPALASFVRSISSGITAFSQNQQVATSLNQTLTALGQGFNLLGEAIGGVAVVALPLANTLAQVATSIGVSSILAGVVAYKALNAVLDGAILRFRILKPLFAITATARIGSALSTGLTSASIALASFNKERGAIDGAPLTGFARLTQVEKELAVNAAGAATRTSSLRIALRSIGPAALAAATSTTALVVGVGALAAGFIFLATRQSPLERATKKLQDATDALAESYGRLKIAAQSAASAQRTVQQQQTTLEQAAITQAQAQKALGESDAPRGSLERRQLLLNLAVATQDVKFATQDYNKALKDLGATEEEQAGARDENKRRIQDEITATKRLIANAVAQGQIIKFLSQEEKARLGLAKAQDALNRASQKNRQSGDAELESLGRRQAALRGFLLAAQAAGRQAVLKPIVFSILLKSPNLAEAIRQIVATLKFGSEQARRAFIQNLIDFSGLGTAAQRALENELLPSTQAAVHTVADWARHKGGPEIGTALGEGVNEGFKATLSISDIIATATAEGLSTAQTLAKVQAQLPGLQRRFTRLDIATQGGTVFKNKAQQKAFENARDELNAANAEIERLTGEITQASKDAAQKIKDAQQKIDEAAQRQIDAVTEGRRGTLLQRKITSAGLTAWLGDDLKTNTVWLNFLKKEKVILLARLKAAGASKEVISQFLSAISNLIFQTSNEIKRINAEIAQNTKERRAALFDTALQKADLRIRIAQARDDVAAELKAREARLRLITQRLVRVRKEVGKNTVEWLNLKAEQAEEIAAIKDLTHQQQQKKNANAQLEFAFLQTLQGFTFNLLGNLIPGFASGGLVGGLSPTTSPSPLGTGLRQVSGGFEQPRIPPGFKGADLGAHAATAAAAAKTQGVTSGQGNTQIHWLKLIFQELHKLNSGRDHPEAHHQRKQGTAAMDYSSGGASSSALAM